MSGDSIDNGVRSELEDLGIYAGSPHREEVFAYVVYSSADVDDLVSVIEDLRKKFSEFEEHENTSVYTSDGGNCAVASIWSSEDMIEKVSSDLSSIPSIVGRPKNEEGFGTMGMFYKVKPEYRQEFLDAFDDVLDVLDGWEGHKETVLFINYEDENDMFIFSQWKSKEHAMKFFRSDTFSETVSWGREVLDGRPRHVFLS